MKNMMVLLIAGLLLVSCSNPFSIDEQDGDFVVFVGKVTYKGAPLESCVVEIHIIEKVYDPTFGTIKDHLTLTRSDTTNTQGRYRIEVRKRFEPLWWRCHPFRYPQGTTGRRKEYEACLEENKDYYYSGTTFPECWDRVIILAIWKQRKEKRWIDVHSIGEWGSLKKVPQTKREFERKWGLPRIDTHPPESITMIPVVEGSIRTDFDW